MNPYTSVGNRLREERKRLRLTQAAAAQLVGVSREMWGRYERGSMPGSEPANALKAAGFDVDYVFTGIREARYLAVAESASDYITEAQRIAALFERLSEDSRKALLDMAQRLRLLEIQAEQAELTANRDEK